MFCCERTDREVRKKFSSDPVFWGAILEILSSSEKNKIIYRMERRKSNNETYVEQSVKLVAHDGYVGHLF